MHAAVSNSKFKALRRNCSFTATLPLQQLFLVEANPENLLLCCHPNIFVAVQESQVVKNSTSDYHSTTVSIWAYQDPPVAVMSISGAIVSSADVLQLCQQTWKLQHTFKSDPNKSGIPPEFAQVEAELDGLTKALSSILEAIDEDQSLLQNASFAAKKAAIMILESCQRTLHELEIFVASYQDVRKVTRPDGSRTIERQWRPIFIRNYMTTIWTNEGGNIYDLKDILILHSESMIFFYEALTWYVL